MSDINQGLLRIAQFEETRLEIENVSRRSSIAVVLRFNKPITSAAFLSKDRFEAVNDYLQQIGTIDASEMEVLFIKRSASERDRWSSHIALPGGRCEPGESDLDAAVRETYEEVGLDLRRDGLYVGPLDQRPLKVEWGMKTIMSLCPYVFILVNTGAKLRLQTSEVATAFWHPYSKLMDPANQSQEIVAMGHRLNLDRLGWLCPRWTHSFIKRSVGKLGFPAIDLHAQDLLHDAKIVDPKHAESIYISASRPYKLWGVTFNVLYDFMAILSPESVLRSHISPPVLQHPDMRLMQYFVMRHIITQRRNVVDKKLQEGVRPGSMDLVNSMYDGLGPYIRQTIALTLLARTSAGIALVTLLAKWLRRAHS